MKSLLETINESKEEISEGYLGKEGAGTPESVMGLEDMMSEYKHTKTILEYLNTDLKNMIFNVFEDSRNVTFYFNGSCSINFEKAANDFKKHKVWVDIPGNTKYAYSVRVSK